MDFRRGVREAYGRIEAAIRRTPLERSDPISAAVGGDVFIKWESEQLTGSFKLRGALNKLRSLPDAEKRKGVVSASTGNHGLAMAHAAKKEGLDLTLFVPTTLTPEKRILLETAGVSLVRVDGSCEKAEVEARRVARESGRTFVSPYNDPDIVMGQGTVGLEILEQCPALKSVVVPLGGGGLVAGIGGFLKSTKPRLRVFGAEPENSRFMFESLKAGRIVDIREEETIADAVAGGLEPGTITFDLCRLYVDSVITVNESRITEAMALLFKHHGRVVEGAGALALAALLKMAAHFRNSITALVVSGGNISAARHRQVLLKH